ncbi:MAG: peptidase MA family metallohydrolase [Anaerolineae bacterium]
MVLDRRPLPFPRRGGLPVGLPVRFSLLVAICVLALLVMPVGARAQAEGDDAHELSHSYAFGQSATFSLRVNSVDEIEDATLYLRINDSYTDTQRGDTDGASATAVRELGEAPLPPFAHIAYWWAYETPDGESVETDRATFQYKDNRFNWLSAGDDVVRVHWISGERAKMVRAVDVAHNALAEIQAALKAEVDGVDLYIYPSQTDLSSAMQLARYGWVSGVAYPELDVALVVVPPTEAGLLSMDIDIPHELTHHAIYDLLGPQGYATLPTWLNEGLATHFEARPDSNYALALEAARQANTLIPISELCLPFPESPARAELAYAQSGSLIRYLQQRYGWSQIRELLAIYADGVACSTGIEKVLGVNIDQLDRGWRAWLAQDQPSIQASSGREDLAILAQDAGPWLMLLGALLLPSALLLLAGRR